MGSRFLFSLFLVGRVDERLHHPSARRVAAASRPAACWQGGRCATRGEPEKYNFDPDKLLSLLIRTVLVFAENEQFILRMNEEGMLDLNMFQRAQSICRSRGLLETVGLDGLVDRSPISSEWTPS